MQLPQQTNLKIQFSLIAFLLYVFTKWTRGNVGVALKINHFAAEAIKPAK